MQNKLYLTIIMKIPKSVRWKRNTKFNEYNKN